ncbi:HdaA/DnaA family protein [Faunimonas pinastri]|uniref:HdaA/DnaA family protein n=1 Tax=Faunimonas pinastri TaxID=1855383 RepID=UPI001EEB5D4A|nr:hypothetical protein [Faunimonas pinastri]
MTPTNAPALKLIDLWPNWPAPTLVLTGPLGAGKTHLAHIWAERSEAIFLRPDQLDEDQPGAAFATGAVVVDGLRPGAVPERALFHLLNAARELRGSVLLVSRQPVADWRVALPDLLSRLRMAAALDLPQPDETLLRQVLVKLFADRQIIVEKSVVDFLLARMERSLASAVRVVETLDREALTERRGITRALAAQVLARFE